jgi:hypothetical protein
MGRLIPLGLEQLGAGTMGNIGMVLNTTIAFHYALWDLLSSDANSTGL